MCLSFLRALPLRIGATALALACARGADAPGGLEADVQPGRITIQFGGTPAKPGYPGIPSWRAVLLQDDGGNLSALHVPADAPLDLSSRRNGWPITILGSRSVAGAEQSDKGRENYARFRVEIMAVTHRSPEQVVVRVAGPSRQKHFAHERTYTFTPRGVAIEGSVLALIDLKRIAWDPHWDRDQIADSHQLVVPLRTQGRAGWVAAPSSGSDAVTPLPEGVDFPLEAELKLRRERPTFVRLFVDRTFASSQGARVMVNNNKDFTAIPDGRQYFEKLLGGFQSGPLRAGERDTFKVRYEFELRP